MAWQRTDDPETVQPLFLHDTPGVEIVPALQPQADDFVFDKLTMSAFEGTPLQLAMRDARRWAHLSRDLRHRYGNRH